MSKITDNLKDLESIQSVNGDIRIGENASATGRLSITDNTSWSSGFKNHSQLYMPNMSGGALSFGFGKSGSSKNLGKLTYNHIADNSDNNFVGVGMWDADNTLAVTAGKNVGVGTITPLSKLHVVGDIGQSVSPTTWPCAIRKVWQGNFTNSTTIDLFTLNSAELPFAGTIYIHAYKSSEGVSGVWTAACIYPTVAPVINQQSYVTRSDEYITPSWSVTNYSPTFRITMGNFSGDTYYTILVDGIVQQNFSTYEGAL